ncbi:MAG: dihydroorotate dehydrogenase-like protein [Spirochaetota bacterium]|nr:dihydroorotate dehydrogenase-like protein [Spirochaetota bacterium]
MSDLSTTYMGLQLKNPIIVSSSRLTYDLEKVKQCEKAGAGAVVLKSLFEEQINVASDRMIGELNFDAYTDAYDYFEETSKDFYINEYLELVEQAKAGVSIPVIASVNCVSDGNWIDYAERFEKMGADALELNVFIIPADVDTTGEVIEQKYVDILKKVKSRVNIPVALKLGSQFSGLANTMKRFADEGADGLVLFNRFYKPDIDIEEFKIKPAHVYSAPEEMAFTLQWMAILSGKVKADLAATTGIQSSADIIKQILAGAQVVELCSVLMKEGIGRIEGYIREIQEYMQRKGFNSLDDFRGKMSQESIEHPETYERSQYIKAIVGIY